METRISYAENIDLHLSAPSDVNNPYVRKGNGTCYVSISNINLSFRH